MNIHTKPLHCIFPALLFAGMTTFFGCAVSMPGKTFTSEVALDTTSVSTLAATLRTDVEYLATGHGERNVFHEEGLRAAERYIETALRESGYSPTFQEYDAKGVLVKNIQAEIRGTEFPDEIFIIGAHYDSVHGSPGANDNASGVAGVLALSRALAHDHPRRTVRFVFFVNEEPPFFWTEEMGSVRYAKAAKARGDNIVGMWSLETMGYFSDEKSSQQYPPLLSWFYPSTGNFLAFVGMSSSSHWVKCSIGRFRSLAAFPSEGAALPWLVPRVGSSDHWSFWKQGFPALMVTDTAPYRYRAYHQKNDLPENLDYRRMAKAVEGLTLTARDLLQQKSMETCDSESSDFHSSQYSNGDLIPIAYS